MAGETIKAAAICLDVRPWSRTSHVVAWLTPAGKVTTVDEDGLVKFYKPGKVKVTATLPSGKSKSYDLTIFSEDESTPQADWCDMSKEKLTMKTGSSTQLTLDPSPSPCESIFAEWISLDSKYVKMNFTPHHSIIDG